LYNKYKRYEVDIEEDYQPDLPIVLGNFAQLGQVALNLIENAVEALSEGEGHILLRTFAHGDHVVFECRDTGPGMSAEVQQDIFKPFFTTKAPGKGTGLGLYICHQIVEKHGGVIEVESTLGQGTSFKVILLRPGSPKG
jgi:two-component system NtrC family sensor kinase